MPTVPVINQAITTDVNQGYGAIRNSADGELGIARGINEIGSQLEEFSLGLLDDLNQAEAKESVQAQTFKDKFDAEEYAAKLMREYPTGFVTRKNAATGAIENVKGADGTDRTITQEYREWANTRFRDNQQKMPSLQAQRAYIAEGGNFFNSSIGSLRNAEMNLRVQTIERGVADRIQKYSATLVNMQTTPGLAVDSAYTFGAAAVTDVTQHERSVLGAEKAGVLKQKVLKELPRSLFEGMENAAIAGGAEGMTRKEVVDFALATLYGADPASRVRKQNGVPTISETMDPNQKAQFIQRFLALKSKVDKADIQDLDQRAANLKAQQRIGSTLPMDSMRREALDDEFIALSNAYMKKVIENSQDPATGITPVQFAEKIGPMLGEKMAHDLFASEKFLTSPPTKQAEMIKSFDEESYNTWKNAFVSAGLFKDQSGKYSSTAEAALGGTFREQVLNSLQGKVSELKKEYDSDFAGTMSKYSTRVRTLTGKVAPALTDLYIFSKDPGAQQALKQRHMALESSAKVYGRTTHDLKYFSLAEAKQIAGKIQEEQDYKKVGDGIVSLYRSDPARFSSAMTQLVQDGGLDARWRFLVHLGGNSQMIREVVDTIKGRFDKVQAPEPYASYVEEVGANKNVKDYIQGVFSKGSWSTLTPDEVSLVQSVVINKARQLHSTGQATSSKDAVQKASDSFLLKRYNIIPRGATGGAGTSLVLPKMYRGVEVTDAQVGTVAANLRRFNTKEGIRALSIQMPPELEAANIPYEKFQDRVRLQGVWALSQDGNYAELWYRDTGPKSGEAPVITEQSSASVPRAARRVITRVPLDLLMTPGHAEAMIKNMAPRADKLPNPRPQGTPP